MNDICDPIKDNLNMDMPLVDVVFAENVQSIDRDIYTSEKIRPSAPEYVVPSSPAIIPDKIRHPENRTTIFDQCFCLNIYFCCQSDVTTEFISGISQCLGNCCQCLGNSCEGCLESLGDMDCGDMDCGD